jgi:hypothetical protein
MIQLFVDGTMNALKHHKIIDGTIGPTSKEAGRFFGNALSTVRATCGNFLELLVDLRAKVVPGQTWRSSAIRSATSSRDYGRGRGRDHSILYTSSDPKCEASGL